MFSWEFYGILRNSYYVQHLRVNAPGNPFWGNFMWVEHQVSLFIKHPEGRMAWWAFLTPNIHFIRIFLKKEESARQDRNTNYKFRDRESWSMRSEAETFPSSRPARHFYLFGSICSKYQTVPIGVCQIFSEFLIRWNLISWVN